MGFFEATPPPARGKGTDGDPISVLVVESD